MYELIKSQYGSVDELCVHLGITRTQLDRQLRSGSRIFLNALADGCRMSRQEVKWEFQYWKETR